jgi:hypothetical protein
MQTCQKKKKKKQQQQQQTWVHTRVVFGKSVGLGRYCLFWCGYRSRFVFFLKNQQTSQTHVAKLPKYPQESSSHTSTCTLTQTSVSTLSLSLAFGFSFLPLFLCQRETKRERVSEEFWLLVFHSARVHQRR